MSVPLLSALTVKGLIEVGAAVVRMGRLGRRSHTEPFYSWALNSTGQIGTDDVNIYLSIYVDLMCW